MHALAAPLLDAPPLRRYGLPEYFRVDTPAAAAHATIAIGGRYMTRFLTVFARLVTDANVANRTVLVEFRDDADRRYALSGAPVTQSASSTNDWAFNVFQRQAEWEVDGTILVPLAPLLLPPTHDIRVFVDNVQAGDQLSLVSAKWEQFYWGEDES